MNLRDEIAIHLDYMNTPFVYQSPSNAEHVLSVGQQALSWLVLCPISFVLQSGEFPGASVCICTDCVCALHLDLGNLVNEPRVSSRRGVADQTAGQNGVLAGQRRVQHNSLDGNNGDMHHGYEYNSPGRAASCCWYLRIQLLTQISTPRYVRRYLFLRKKIYVQGHGSIYVTVEVHTTPYACVQAFAVRWDEEASCWACFQSFYSRD